jgi:hypothetical protein
MTNRLRRDGEAEHDTTAAAVIARPARRLIVTMLLTAAALDLARLARQNRGETGL